VAAFSKYLRFRFPSSVITMTLPSREVIKVHIWKTLCANEA